MLSIIEKSILTVGVGSDVSWFMDFTLTSGMAWYSSSIHNIMDRTHWLSGLSFILPGNYNNNNNKKSSGHNTHLCKASSALK